MAWKDWRKEVPKVTLSYGCYDVKRRTTGQKHVLFRLVDPFTIHNVYTGEDLELPAGTLSDGSSVPGPLWGALDAKPADLLLPGFAHDYAYRKGATAFLHKSYHIASLKKVLGQLRLFGVLGACHRQGRPQDVAAI